MTPVQVYKSHARKDHRGGDLISMHRIAFRPAHENTDKGRRNIVDLRKRARRALKASINLVQQRWGKLDRRKRSISSIHIYEIRPRVGEHGYDLSSDVLPYSPLWYRGSNAIVDAVGYSK